MITYKDFIIVVSGAGKIIKYSTSKKEVEKELEAKDRVTVIKILKTLDESHKLKLAFCTPNDLNLYDMMLSPLKTVPLKTSGEEAIRLISLSNTEFMTFTKEGSISVWNNQSLDEQKNASIFSLKSEDYIDLILIKSKEYFLFTLEK